MRDYFKELYDDEDNEDEEMRIVKDGERMHVGMMFADGSSISASEVNAHFKRTVEDGQRQLDAEKDEYDARLREAWRHPGQADRSDPAVRNLADEKEEYDARLREAWKNP